MQNTDCPIAAPVCDTRGGDCVTCAVDTDCKDTTKPLCDTQRDVPACVQCIRNSDCPVATPNCGNANVCVP